jgi:hypothetical protein
MYAAKFLGSCRYGNARQTGGDTFTVTMAGLDNGMTTAGTVVDNGDGTYSVSYILTLTDTYRWVSVSPSMPAVDS